MLPVRFQASRELYSRARWNLAVRVLAVRLTVPDKQNDAMCVIRQNEIEKPRVLMAATTAVALCALRL
jgi:hypothetical protein